MLGVPEKTLHNPAELETSKSLRDFNSNIPEPPQLERANHEQKVANHAQTIHVGDTVESTVLFIYTTSFQVNVGIKYLHGLSGIFRNEISGIGVLMMAMTNLLLTCQL